MKSKIILFGPQGSGKGTQAGISSKNLGIPHISTGDIFRQNIKDKTTLGIKIQELINAGNLVPDEVTNKIIKKRLEENDCKDGFILDGFPRNVDQAKFLDSFIEVDQVIEISISDEDAVERLSQRRTCSACGEIYHLTHIIPKIEGECDKCGGKLIIREDDKEDSIRKRLDTYHSQTEEIINHYKEKGIFQKVDGTKTIEEVNIEVSKILNT